MSSKLITLSFFFVLVSTVSAWAGAWEDIQAGKRAYDQKDMDKAISLSTKAIKSGELGISYQLAYGYYVRGIARAAKSNARDAKQLPVLALKDLDKAASLTGKSNFLKTVYINRASIYFSRHFFYNAKENFEAVLKIDPKYEVAINLIKNIEEELQKGVTGNLLIMLDEDFKKATSAMEDGAYDAANSIFTSLLKRKEINKQSRGFVYLYRGDTYAAKKLYKKAIKDYSRSVRVFPNVWYLYYVRAHAYSGAINSAKAAKDYTRVLRINPKHVPSLVNRGNIHLIDKVYSLAIEDYSKAIEFKSDDALAYRNRGRALMGLRSYDKALADFNQTKRLDPNDETVGMFISRIEALKFAEDVLAETNAFLQTDKVSDEMRQSEIAKTHFSNGKGYLKRGDYDLAVDSLNKVLLIKQKYAGSINNVKMEPELYEIHKYLGNAHTSMKRFDLSIEDYKKALAIKPDYTEAELGLKISTAVFEALKKKKQKKKAAN